ncbi:MAG: hypothetical protein CMI73_00185 [Candidatus Pelagibacter sp.]|nr:hypothetical protein [Candidatus Pelagibacter sp.]OUV88672.1 MAG: hypothetical protein CBC96_00185 [Pelagibacteraceae bacterium TMED136]
MKKNFLIYGYGNIGKKHHRLLKKYTNSNIYIISARKNKNFFLPKELSKLKFVKFQLIIIVNDTNLHLPTLIKIRKYFKSTPVLVEKPLLISNKINHINKNIFINFNLRLHPLIKKLKTLVNKDKFFYCNITCFSFLPTWRKKNYKHFYSSSAKRGGGVLYDLSHEFDLMNFLFGKYKVTHSVNKKISNLSINSDDYVQAEGQFYKKSKYFNITLSYFSRIQKREIYLEGKNISIHACLLNNRITIINNKKKKILNFQKFNLETTFEDTYKCILNKKSHLLCNIDDSVFLTNIFKTIKGK